MADNTRNNYCDKDGQCTAQCKEEMDACRFYRREELARPGMCVFLSKLGDHCLSPDVLVAKWKELQNQCHSPTPTGESRQEKRNE